MEQDRGFFAALFDTSFSSLVTRRVLGVLYLIVVVLLGLALLVCIIAAFTQKIWLGLVLLILSPLIYFLYLIWIRIWFEVIVVLFNIADNTAALVHRGPASAPVAQQAAPPSGGSSVPPPSLSPTQ